MEKIDVNVYDRIAHHFNNTRIYQWKWVTEFLNSVENSCIVYDIGCGNGRNMDNNRLLMYGIDSCKSFVKMCTQKGLNVFEACMTSLPFRSESADAIICIASFHHLKTVEERLNSLKEMKRVLKKNGTILLSIWSIQQPLKTRRVFNTYGDTIVPWNKYGETFERFYYIFKIEEFESLCKSSGLNIIKHVYDCGNELFYLKHSK
jgi:SAM-dependent methyltransferase